MDEYTDLSFLKKENFDEFIEKVKRLQLSQEEIDKLKEQREREIDASLIKLNNDIYKDETEKISEQDRVYLVAASIIATIGIPNKVAALEKSELKSSTEEGNRDGDIILRKIKAFLNEKAHQKDDIVKFIDFSNDGYTRSDRKKASCNLKDTDRAKERYQELVNLVRFGKSKLNIFTENEYYEGHIDPSNGADWNQTAPKDTKPTLSDFKKTVSDYLSWEVSCLLKRQDKENDRLGK